MATNFDDIPTSEIGVFADVDAATFTKLVNRALALLETIQGVVGAKKIVAQAIATQTAGNGLGLHGRQHNYVEFVFGPLSISTGITYVTTTIPIDGTRLPEIAFTISGGTWEYSARAISKHTSANWVVEITRDASSTGTQTVNGRVFAMLIG